MEMGMYYAEAFPRNCLDASWNVPRQYPSGEILSKGPIQGKLHFPLVFKLVQVFQLTSSSQEVFHFHSHFHLHISTSISIQRFTFPHCHLHFHSPFTFPSFQFQFQFLIISLFLRYQIPNHFRMI